MRKPYIGITGFMSQSDVLAVLDFLPQNSPRKLMVGVLASQKTVFLGQQNKWPNRYPKADQIANIFPNHPNALNLIHYNTKDLEALADQLDRLVAFGGEYIDGFQLNIAWPDIHALAKFRSKHPDQQIVLQIGHRAFDEVQNDPETLARRVGHNYLGFVDYILLDPSGGLGKPFDSEVAKLYLGALRAENLEQFVHLGIAGGLSSSTLNLVEPLMKDFPQLCIDAEGRLRDTDDHLDPALAKAYTQKALEVFGL